MDTQASNPLTFGPFELIVESTTLLRDGVEIPLRPGPFRVLRVLCENRGVIINRIRLAELAEVPTGTPRLPMLSAYLTAIKKALGNDWAFYLEQISKRGCRLRAETPVPFGELTARLESLCGREKAIDEVFAITGHRTAIAIDSSFEIHRSPEYKGWSKKDIEIELMSAPMPIFAGFDRLMKADPKPPKLPNNKKYRICGLDRDSTEISTLHIKLAPTDFFTTDVVERLNREKLLSDAAGRKTSAFAKYGSHLLDFEVSQIPHKVGVECVLALGGEKLLLGRRQKEVRHEGGKWALSFEENMNADPHHVRPPDKDFFDTVMAGLDEELGITDCPVSRVKILSLMMHAGALAAFATALVYSPDRTVDDVRASWDLRSKDGRKEIKEFDEIDWTLDALAPMLLRKTTELASGLKISPEQWHWTARSRALLALFHKYGVTNTLTNLTARHKRHIARKPSG